MKSVGLKVVGQPVDAYLERLMNERDELAEIVERAASRVSPFSLEETRAKIERGFLQSERGEVVDGETFSAGLARRVRMNPDMAD